MLQLASVAVAADSFLRAAAATVAHPGVLYALLLVQAERKRTLDLIPCQKHNLR